MLQYSPRPIITSLLPTADTIPIISNLLFTQDNSNAEPATAESHASNQKSVTFSDTVNEKSTIKNLSQNSCEETETNSCGHIGESVDSTETALSDLSNKQKKIKTLRPKTTYSLAYPHPTPWQKLHLRPKKHLQLQQWTNAASRPFPAYDVLPASCFSTSSRNASAKFARLSRWRTCFGPDEMFVTRAGDYSFAPNSLSIADTASNSSDESVSPAIHDPGSAVAAICRIKGRRRTNSVTNTELALDDGSVWEASQLANGGGYEFVWASECGKRTTVRWVTRTSRSKAKRQRSSSLVGIGSFTGAEASAVLNRSTITKRFTFSTIDPQSRRHPVIATLTGTCMEIYDYYRLPSGRTSSIGSTNSHGSDAEERISVADKQSSDNVVSEQQSGSNLASSTSMTHQTSEQLHKLILVSGIWVALQEGWSPNFRYSKAAIVSGCTSAPAPPSLARSSSSASFCSSRASCGPVMASVPTSARMHRFASCPSTPSANLQEMAEFSKVAPPLPSPMIVSLPTYPPAKQSRRSTVRRALTQQHFHPQQPSIAHSGLGNGRPTWAMSGEGLGLSGHAINVPEYQYHQHQHEQITQRPTFYEPTNATLPRRNSVAVPVVSASTAPRQPRKLNRLVRGLLVGAVNKIDKHTEASSFSSSTASKEKTMGLSSAMAPAANVPCTEAYGYGNNVTTKDDDTWDNGTVRRPANITDGEVMTTLPDAEGEVAKRIKATRRRTVL